MTTRRAGFYSDSLTSSATGRPLINTPFTVYNSDGVTPSTRWTDATKATPTVAATATDENGNAAFYTEPGLHFIEANGLSVPVFVPEDVAEEVEHFVIVFGGDLASTTWSNQPAGLTELQGVARQRTRADLTRIAKARLVVWNGTAGAANAELRLQASADQSAWDYLDAVGGPAAPLDGGSVALTSGFVDLVAAAKADVWLRVVGINGDGAADPTLGMIAAEFIGAT